MGIAVIWTEGRREDGEFTRSFHPFFFLLIFSFLFLPLLVSLLSEYLLLMCGSVRFYVRVIGVSVKPKSKTPVVRCMASYPVLLFRPDPINVVVAPYHRHFSGDESFGDFAITAGTLRLQRNRNESLRADERKMMRDNAFGYRGRAYDEHGDRNSGPKL